MRYRVKSTPIFIQACTVPIADNATGLVMVLFQLATMSTPQGGFLGLYSGHPEFFKEIFVAHVLLYGRIRIM